MWIHHNEEEKHIFITSVLFCPHSTFPLLVCHCFHFQVCFKEEITHFRTVTAFAHFPHSSFLPKNERTSIKKVCHLFQGSSFTDILLFQRPCKNLRQHFYSISLLISNTVFVFKKSFIFQTGWHFPKCQYLTSNMLP